MKFIKACLLVFLIPFAAHGGVTPPILQAVEATNGAFKFIWSNVPQQTYLIQFKTNLLQTNWNIVGGAIKAANTSVTGVDTMVSGTSGRFYRLWLLVTNASDVTKPTLNITAPTPGQKWSNSTFVVTGTANDNKLVAAAFFQFNSNIWAAAITTNKWTNWNSSVLLLPGTNTVAAYAVDTNANYSTTSSVNLIYVVSGILQVRTTGQGSLSPNYSNALLQIGSGYSMKATAATGFAFTNWVVSSNWAGGVISNNATVSFIMRSNLTLQANFVDTKKPVISITNLVSGMQVSNANYVVQGTATDNVAVVSVYCQLNGTDWVNPTSFDGRNWSDGVTLNPGTNQFQAYAVDTSGNVSATNTVSFVWVVNYAFDYLGSYQAPEIINYTNKAGQALQEYGFPGQVQLYVTNTATALSIQRFAHVHAGIVIGQIPSMGYYLIYVTPGNEASFIVAANTNGNVIFALPNVPLEMQSDMLDELSLLGPTGQVPLSSNFGNAGAVGNNTLLYIPDNYIDLMTVPSCPNQPFSHGSAMAYVATQGLSGTGAQLNMRPVAGGHWYANIQLLVDLVLATGDLANHPTSRAIINMSLGGSSTSVQGQKDFLLTYMQVINIFSKLAPDVFKRMVVVVSSGNGLNDHGVSGTGFDLTSTIQNLHSSFPSLFGALDGGTHFIIVGGEGSHSGYYDDGENYATALTDSNGFPLIIYAQGRQVEININGCTADGTSPAAAQVSGLIAQLLSANPNLTVAQIIQALFKAAKNNSPPYWNPPINAVQQAITNLFYSTLTIQMAGTGPGTVTANPPGLVYTNGTIVNLTAFTNAFSTFGGWSGAVSSMALSVSITMNINKTVTATFNAVPLSLTGSGGNVGDFLGTATGCGFSAQLSLGDLVYFEVDNNGGSGPTIATVNGTVNDETDNNTMYYTWQGKVTWNGSAFTGSLPRTDNANRPSLSLTITPNAGGQYILNVTVPFTEYLYNLDGSCTGPVETFNYQVNGVVLSPQ